MFEIINETKHDKFLENYNELSERERRYRFLILPSLVYASIGAITWAIRGTSGWGGFDGAVVHGMIWGLLWYYFLYKIGLDGRKTSFWLALGVSIGGMLGYGIYVSWIRGEFLLEVGNAIDINPIYGCLGFINVGIVWLGIGGIFLGWVLGDKHRQISAQMLIKTWMPRLIIPIIFAALGVLLTRLFPTIFFPYYSETFYTEAECPICVDRIYSTNTTNIAGLFWWIGAMVVSFIQKDKITKVSGGLFGVGYGILYLVSALWVLGYTYASGYTDWWKVWELTAGLMAGILYGIFQYWCINQHVSREKNKQKKGIDAQKQIDSNVNGTIQQIEDVKSPQIVREPTLPKNIIERRANIYLALTTFFEFGILCYGGSYMLGIVLELYNETEVEQYTFPPGRAIIFAISVVILLYWLIRRLLQIIRESKVLDYKQTNVRHIEDKLIYTMSFILLIGEITIWPSEIGILYAVYFIPTLYGIIKHARLVNY